MTTKRIKSGDLVFLRQIEMRDCTACYVDWLNDPEVNKYLETKWSRQDIGSIKAFVRAQRENNHSVLFAIVSNTEKGHIGNIKIGPVHEHYKHADISYFIGDKRFWNKGIATEAIKLVCEYGFEELGLHRIEAGVYAVAVGSWKALEKNGFQREGVFREQVILGGGGYMDIYRYGLLRSDWA